MATTERLAPVRSAPVRSGKVSRRGFLAGSAGLTFALSVPTALFERPNAALAAVTASEAVCTSATIGTNGAITLAIPVPEVCDVPMTDLPIIFAAEIDADWPQISSRY